MFIFKPQDCVDAPDVHESHKAKASGLVRAFIHHYLGFLDRAKVFKVALKDSLIKVLWKSSDEDLSKLSVDFVVASAWMGFQLLERLKCLCIQAWLLTRHCLQFLDGFSVLPYHFV